MITKINSILGQQIVNTIKDVCSHDINFIDPSGIIIASTNEARIGQFHEAGYQAAQAGTTLEVTESSNFSGTMHGINMPLYHDGRLLAVIGITGEPDEIRKYASLAGKITTLLIREQELNQYSHRQADKKHFIIQSLIKNETENQELLTKYLKEFHVDPGSEKRLILIQPNKQYTSLNPSFSEQQIQQLFSSMKLELYTFNYPGEFIAVTDTTDFDQKEKLLKTFAQEHPQTIQIAVGKSVSLFRLHLSYESSLTAMKSIMNHTENYILSDELTLELILSSVSPDNRNLFLEKTIQKLSPQDRELLNAYFSEGMSLSRTCEKLFLHKNTLQYKLNHIAQKCRLNPRHFQDAVLLYLALKF